MDFTRLWVNVVPNKYVSQLELPAEEGIRSVDVVEDAQHSEALVEFEMVEVVHFRRRKTGKMIPTVQNQYQGLFQN